MVVSLGLALRAESPRVVGGGRIPLPHFHAADDAWNMSYVDV